ncbi:ATP/GTP-binding protein [Streptomyces caniscabiei]|uniref:ATP/GTP-binding protein n=1 Tax=Streptomyces caniscabiei TaxID=2746961 RepID=UPI00117CB886|nr:ATP/GTP-binding protein [Streptomyces caniscabiei]
MLTHLALAAGMASTLIFAGAASAYADDDPDISTGDCDLMSFCVGVGAGGQDGNAGKGSAEGSQASSGGSSSKCTVRRADPQPPPGSIFYQGEGKIVYERTCPGGGTTFFGTDPAADAPEVDPAVLAQQAVDKMLLAGPDININPKPGGRGLVGMPVWMAVDQSPTTWGPNTASASAGGVTVTATAKVSQVVWAMGDGASVTCTGAGTVYQKSYGLKKSPDCGHVYTQPSNDVAGGTYKVTATSTWVINWQGGGANGQLTEVRSSSVAVTIVESQAVNS